MTDSFSEQDLRAAARGDEVAFTRVFRCLQPAVLRYLGTLAPAVAEDLAAETWVRVVRGLPGFVGDPAGLRAWVLTIAHHRYVDYVRRVARTPAVVDEPVETVADTAPATAGGVRRAPTVEDHVAEVISTEAALRLIGRLPADQAQVVLLRVVAGLDVARTAQVLGKRPGAVRVAAHRGLTRLRRILDEQPSPTPDGAPGGGPGPAVTHRDPRSVTGES